MPVYSPEDYERVGGYLDYFENQSRANYPERDFSVSEPAPVEDYFQPQSQPDFDLFAPAPQNPFAFDPTYNAQAAFGRENEEPFESVAFRRLPDYAIFLENGLISIPEAAVGLLDIPFGGVPGHLLEKAGIDFKAAKEYFEDFYSPEQKSANQRVVEASTVGNNFFERGWNTVKAVAENPSVAAQTIVESAPLLIPGAGAARLARAVTKASPYVAAGIGEGVVGAGLSAERIRQESPTGLLSFKQAALAAGTGALTGLIGGVSGRLAKYFNVADVDTMMAGGLTTRTPAKEAILSRVFKSALSEGLVEELPQSAQEQIAQNLALDRPWDEGVEQAAVLGFFAGAGTGAVAGGISRGDQALQVINPETGTSEFRVPATPPPLPIAEQVAPPAPLTEAPPASQPEWLKNNLANLVQQADAAGVSDQIESLAAERLTANEIAKRLNLDDPNIVRAVRTARNIPGMEDETAFEAWIASRKPPVTPTPPSASTPEVPVVPAIVTKSGEVIKGNPGDAHDDIIKRQSMDWQIENRPQLDPDQDFAFVGNNGNVLSRRQAADALGEKLSLTSQRLRQLQKNKEAVSAAPLSESTDTVKASSESASTDLANRGTEEAKAQVVTSPAVKPVIPEPVDFVSRILFDRPLVETETGRKPSFFRVTKDTNLDDLVSDASAEVTLSDEVDENGKRKRITHSRQMTPRVTFVLAPNGKVYGLPTTYSTQKKGEKEIRTAPIPGSIRGTTMKKLLAKGYVPLSSAFIERVDARDPNNTVTFNSVEEYEAAVANPAMGRMGAEQRSAEAFVAAQDPNQFTAESAADILEAQDPILGVILEQLQEIHGRDVKPSQITEGDFFEAVETSMDERPDVFKEILREVGREKLNDPSFMALKDRRKQQSLIVGSVGKKIYEQFTIGKNRVVPEVKQIGAGSSSGAGVQVEAPTEETIEAEVVPPEPTLIERLEALKDNSPNGLQMVIIPGLDAATFKAIRNTALDIAILAIKTGQTLADAVASAIDYIRSELAKEKITDFDEAGIRNELFRDVALELPKEAEIIASKSFIENLALADEIQATQSTSDPDDPSAAEATNPDGTKTKVGNVYDMVQSRPGLNAAIREESVRHALGALEEAGLNVVRHEDGLWTLSDNFSQQEIEGQKLATILEREIFYARAENRPERIANLLNTVAVHLARDGNEAFSQPLRDQLYSLAQGERSSFGRALGSLAMWGKVLANVAMNPQIHLARLYSKFVGGEQISPVVKRIREEFPKAISDEETKAALTPLNIPGQAGQMVQSNARDYGSRVYRKVQGRLKAKVPKTQEQKERKSREDEAIEVIIFQAKNLGITEPKPLPGQKLTPDQRLAMMTTEKTRENIQKAIEQAVSEGEQNAGWRAEENAVRGNEEKLAEIQARREVGEVPPPEMIELGLRLKEFQHWKAIRDSLLNYSPTTVKLVEDVITGRFRGTRFKPPTERPADLRIDLRKLAVSHQDEVKRVFEAQFAEITDLMRSATPETLERVSQEIRAKLTAELAARRLEVVDRVFAARATGREKPAEIEALKKQINAGLLEDQRLTDEALAQQAAENSSIQNLLPNVTDLVNRILKSPRYKKDDIKTDIAAGLVKQLGLTDEQANQLSSLIYKSLDGTDAQPGPLRKALVKALERVQSNLTDGETKVLFKKGKRSLRGKKARKQDQPIWSKIEQAVKAGLFDSTPILEDLAREQGWTVPTQAEKDQIRKWVEEEIRLRTPTARQIDAAGGDIQKATDIAFRGTENDRNVLIGKIKARWSLWAEPVSFRKWLSGGPIAQNNARAVDEWVAANILNTLGFMFFRQPMEVIAVGVPINAASRSAAHLMERPIDAQTFSDLGNIVKDAAVARVSSLGSVFRSAARTARYGPQRKRIDQTSSNISIFDRMLSKADQLEDSGNKAGAWVLRFSTILRGGFRVSEVLDDVQGLSAEEQEMRQQLTTELRRQGKTKSEIDLKRDTIFGQIKLHAQWALEEANTIAQEKGGKTEFQIKSDADNLKKGKLYDMMRSATDGKIDFRAENEELKKLHAWEKKEVGGVPGLIAAAVAKPKELAQKAGIPTLGIFQFGNAMGISANRALTFLGGALIPENWGRKILFGNSPWYEGERNLRQRKVESIIGLSAISFLVCLAVLKRMKVQEKYPEEKEEKEKFIAEGGRLNTVRFYNDDGSWFELPINTGPLQVVAPALRGIGHVQGVIEKTEKAQKKLDEEAAKTGLQAEQLKVNWSAETGPIIGKILLGVIEGGRTASGKIQQFYDYGEFNLKKGLVSNITPTVPFLNMWREASRALGVTVDMKTASFLQMMVPSPWSGNQKLNSLGEPMANENDVARFLQTMSGGFSYGSGQTKDLGHAHQQIIAAGFSTPETGRSKGYDFSGTIRQMNPPELEKYTVNKGKFFKQELEAVDVVGLPEPEAHKIVQQAFQRANTRALQEVGANVYKAGSARPATAPRRFGATRYSSATSRLIGGSSRRGSRLPSSRFSYASTGPTRSRLRRGRSRGLSSRTTRRRTRTTRLRTPARRRLRPSSRRRIYV